MKEKVIDFDTWYDEEYSSIDSEYSTAEEEKNAKRVCFARSSLISKYPEEYLSLLVKDTILGKKVYKVLCLLGLNKFEDIEVNPQEVLSEKYYMLWVSRGYTVKKEGTIIISFSSGEYTYPLNITKKKNK